MDILSSLNCRNMINFIGSTFDRLSTACLSNLRLTCSLYRELVDGDKRSARRLNRSRRWMYGQPALLPVCLEPGHMVTALSASGDSIMFGLLGYDAAVNIFIKDTLKMSARLIQSREFPASISALDYNHKVVVTCAYESMNGSGLTHAVYVWWRDDKRLASKIFPHAEMIRSVKLTTKYLLTASNDKTIAVTDLSSPDQPKLLHRLADHADYVSCLDTDAFHFVSVSVDNVLKVWSLVTFKSVLSLPTGSAALKVAMCWPVAATGGQTSILLWNIELGYLIRKLQLNAQGSLSALAMTWFPSNDDISRFQNGKRRTDCGNVLVVAGDNQGTVCIWDCSAIIAGHPGVNPHRYIQIGTGGNMISSIAVDESSIITGDWSGQVLVWKFVRDS